MVKILQVEVSTFRREHSEIFSYTVRTHIFDSCVSPTLEGKCRHTCVVKMPKVEISTYNYLLEHYSYCPIGESAHEQYKKSHSIFPKQVAIRYSRKAI